MKLPVTSGAVVVLGIIFGTPCLWTQNLGDIARQDRERRSRLSSHSPVLTNDDLAREHILTPELKYRILTTQGDPGATAGSTPAPQCAEEHVTPSPVAVGMVQEIRSSAAHQPPALEVIQPASIAAQTLPARTQAYTEPAVAATAAINEPISLGEYARQLRAYRAGFAYESASIAPLPPPTRVTVQQQPEISLGEYARQLRLRRAAEEHARLLAQDDTSIASSLTGDADLPIRYDENRPSAAALSLRQRRVVAAVVAAKKNSSPTAQEHIAVTVRRGDSLWRLARTYLGSGARWQSISFLKNHAGLPPLIRAGEVVLIPVVGPRRARASEVASRVPGNPSVGLLNAHALGSLRAVLVQTADRW